MKFYRVSLGFVRITARNRVGEAVIFANDVAERDRPAAASPAHESVQRRVVPQRGKVR